MRLIDADAERDGFMEMVYEQLADDPDNIRANLIIDYYDSLPTVEPVRGEWIDKGWDGDFSYKIDGCGNCWKVAQCSICGHELRVNQKTNFCPNCGADMRKKVEE